jgi:hypothetical protein
MRNMLSLMSDEHANPNRPATTTANVPLSSSRGVRLKPFTSSLMRRQDV